MSLISPVLNWRNYFPGKSNIIHFLFMMKDLYIRLKPYLANISWIVFDKFFNLGLAFLVTIFVSRYLGPEKYGILAYATSLAALLGTTAHMGLSGIVVREIVEFPEKKQETLGTTFVLKGLGSLIGFAILCLIALLTNDQGSAEFWVLLIAALTILLQPFQSIKFWFQANVQARYITTAQITGKLISSGFKLLLIFLGASLIPFAFGSFIQITFVTVTLLYLYQHTANLPIQTWLPSLKRAKKLLRSGSIIFIGTVFASVYLKTDQIMLRWLVDPKEVGIYSIAATLSEVWYFLPTAIVVSIFPKLIQLRNSSVRAYKKRLQQVFDLLFVIAFLVAIIVTFLAKPLVYFSLGEAYLGSAPILSIHIWAGIFIFMRAAFSKWILTEHLEIFSLVTQGSGAISNIVLNFILIPRFGGYGAALATLFSYATASYLSLLLHNKTREVFWMMTYSMFLVPRLGLRYLRQN